tara:strand:- start:60 stop:413 length:354 start_codon:yes stop_codon:yes gene_type:complete
MEPTEPQELSENPQELTESNNLDLVNSGELSEPNEDTQDLESDIRELLRDYHEPTNPTNAQLVTQLATGDLLIDKSTGNQLIVLAQPQLELSRELLRVKDKDSNDYLLLKERTQENP